MRRNELRRKPWNAGFDSPSARSGWPGKRTQVSSLPPRPAGACSAVQLQRDPAAATARPDIAGSTAESLARSSRRWMDVAMRPDLCQDGAAPGRGSGGERIVQRAAAHGPGGGGVNPDLGARIDGARGRGRPLDAATGAEMSSAFGADVSSVRIHSDPEAGRISRSLGARAFTTGSDVFFDDGQYRPDTPGGKWLLAHELTHVVQQGGAASGVVRGKYHVGPASDRYEEEADRMADIITSARRVSPGPLRGGNAAAEQGMVRAAPALGSAPVVQRVSKWEHTGNTNTEREGEYMKQPGSDAQGSDAAKKPAAPFKPDAFDTNVDTLWQRVEKIEALKNSALFKAGLDGFVSTMQANGKKLLAGGTPSNDEAEDVGADYVDTIIRELERIRGLEVPHRWYVENQGKEGFEDALNDKAESSAKAGRFWSKLNVRRSQRAIEATGGIYLEATIGGVLFNGLGFGFASWDRSPAMGDLWKKLSTTFGGHLHGNVSADVLDGQHQRSVLTTLEWEERIKPGLVSGRIKSFDVNIYQFDKNRFEIVETVTIKGDEEGATRSEDELDQAKAQKQKEWDDMVPSVRITPEWNMAQAKLDRCEKVLHELEEKFKDQDAAILVEIDSVEDGKPIAVTSAEFQEFLPQILAGIDAALQALLEAVFEAYDEDA